MNDFEKKIDNYIMAHGLLAEGSLVIVGLSGGADSVCLLRVLRALQDVHRLRLTAVHVNHGIRGAEAEADEAFAIALCRDLQVPIRIFRADIPAMAKAEGISPEEAGRHYRYQVFEEVRSALGADAIAVAHHRDDQAETVLMHLFRGSSLRGLCGMRPVRGRIIRPLLDVTKAEILDYLKDAKVSWQEDATNQDTDYTRNRVRNVLLPQVNAQINSGASAHIAQAAASMGDVMDYIDRQTAQAMARVRIKGERRPDLESDAGQLQTGRDCNLADGLSLDLKAFALEDVVIRRELVRRAALEAAGSVRDVTSGHIEALLGLAVQGEGRLHLPGDLVVSCHGGEMAFVKSQDASLRMSDLKLERIKAREPEVEDQALIPLPMDGRVILLPVETQIRSGETTWKTGDEYGEAGREADAGSGGPALEVMAQREREPGALFDADHLPLVPKKIYTKWVDYDKITSGLVFRKRREGDFMIIGGAHKKTLKRLLIDMKVDRQQRRSLWLLADGNHIVWIPQLDKMSEAYKIREDTMSILRIDIRECKNYEGKD